MLEQFLGSFLLIYFDHFLDCIFRLGGVCNDLKDCDLEDEEIKCEGITFLNGSQIGMNIALVVTGMIFEVKNLVTGLLLHKKELNWVTSSPVNSFSRLNTIFQLWVF